MKKFISIILSLLLIAALMTESLAEPPQIASDLFSNAKEGLRCLASGEYERLVTILPFTGTAPSSDEWRSFADGNYSTLHNGVQTEYAVAYWSSKIWKLAIPLQEPSNDAVEVFVLLSQDGSTFTGYRYARWSDITTELKSADYISWNREYTDVPLIFSFD